MLLQLPDIDFGPWTKWADRDDPREGELDEVPRTFGGAGLYLLASWPDAAPAERPLATALPAEVLYVGKSRHPGQRLLSHEKARRYGREHHDPAFSRLWVALWDSGWWSFSHRTVKPLHAVTLSACEEAVILLYMRKHGNQPLLNRPTRTRPLFPKGI